MKVLIVARPEGASGLTWANKLNTEKPFKSLATDINEAAKAVRECGYEILTYTPEAAFHIYNWLHLPYLDKDIKFVSAKEIYEQINEIFAVVLVGMTAKAGTLNAFMDSTYNLVGWHDYYLNDVLMGEIGMYKNYFANFGIPVVFVTGDEAACEEAKKEIPEVKTVAVKKAKCRNVAVAIEGAVERIAQTCLEALKKPATIAKKPTFPLVKRIVLSRTEFAADTCRWFSDTTVRIDGRTVETTLNELKYFTDLV